MPCPKPAAPRVAPILLLLLAASPALAAAPAGPRLYLQCQSCHSLAAGAPHKVGPNLNGVIGAKAASRPGYAYSPALTASGLVWDDATLDRWLAKPSAVVAGSKMLYPGMPSAPDRQALIAYLKAASR